MSSKQTLLARNSASPYAISGNRRRGHGLHDHLLEAGREIGREVIHVNLAAAEAFANEMVATGEYDSIKVRDEADLTQAPDLIDALARLKAFRATRSAGDVIDEGSGLTANDIDVITSFVTEFSSSP
jgi:hypothetical protein